MSNYGSGMGMIFTNSGKQASRTIIQAPVIQAPVIQAPVIQAPVIQAPIIQAQARSFQPIMNAAGRAAAGGASNRGFRTMDLGNLKTNKSCGSCGH